MRLADSIRTAIRYPESHTREVQMSIVDAGYQGSYGGFSLKAKHLAPDYLAQRGFSYRPSLAGISKRLIDVFGALTALILLAPVMGVIYVTLMLTVGTPIFAHRRVGRNGGTFRCYKFRSMVR